MGSYYVDTRMPFGSRLSSLHMQRIALFLQRALQALDMIALIYWEDALIICPPQKDPFDVFNVTWQLVWSVGLPIAWDKLVSPCKTIRFLGIIIDVVHKEVRIPQDKIDAFVKIAIEARGKKTITRRNIQSIVGNINHLGKAVCPARLFMNRILALLRAMKGRYASVNDEMCKDLSWFITVLSQYNGRSLIVHGPPSVYIEADSCMIGGGGWSGSECYSYEYKPACIEGWSISELEAYNCLIAARVFLRETHDAMIQVTCDNSAAVMSLSSGAARDKNILAICRAFWFLAAQKNLRFIFVHAPGTAMVVADTLSRRALSPEHHRKAQLLIARRQFTDLHVLPEFCDIDNYF